MPLRTTKQASEVWKRYLTRLLPWTPVVPPGIPSFFRYVIQALYTLVTLRFVGPQRHDSTSRCCKAFNWFTFTSQKLGGKRKLTSGIQLQTSPNSFHYQCRYVISQYCLDMVSILLSTLSPQYAEEILEYKNACAMIISEINLAFLISRGILI